MVENNERIWDAIRGIPSTSQVYSGERKKSGAYGTYGTYGTYGSGSSFVPTYKKGMFAPKFKDYKKYQ